MMLRLHTAVFTTRCPLCAVNVIAEPSQLVRLIGAHDGPDAPVIVEVDHAPDTHRPYIITASAYLRGALTAAGVATITDADYDDDPHRAKPAAFVFVLEGLLTQENP